MSQRIATFFTQEKIENTENMEIMDRYTRTSMDVVVHWLKRHILAMDETLVKYYHQLFSSIALHFKEMKLQI